MNVAGEQLRFSTPYRVNVPMQFFRPNIETKRLYQKDTLKRHKVLQEMLINSIFAYDETGEIWWVSEDNYHNLYITSQLNNNKRLIATTRSLSPTLAKVEDFDYEAADNLRGLYTVPVGSWGDEFDIMSLDLGKEAPPAFNDLPPTILNLNLQIQSQLIKKLLTLGDPVYIGINNSAGCLNGEGLMSVLYPHLHTWKFGHEFADLTPEKIKAIRQQVRWDDRLSLLAAQSIVDFLKNDSLASYWPQAQIEADKMGFTINLPGFTPDQLTQPSFVNAWHGLSLIIHAHLKYYHQAMFESDLDEVINFVRQAHFQAELDENAYQQFFRPKQNSDGQVVDQLKLLEQAQQLRYAYGWAGGIQFRSDGAFVGVIFGFFNGKMGPVEGMGVQLERLSAPLSPELMAQKAKFYQQIFQEVISQL
jgi:hypothetical protein